MASTVLGYNIIIKSNDKKFLGVTSNSFSISPETKDSITKDDLGVKRSIVTGYTWEAGVEGLVMVKTSGETTVIDRNDIMAMAKAGTIVEVTYGQFAVGSKVQVGNAIVSAFSESTDSENEGTYSVTLKGTGALAEETVA